MKPTFPVLLTLILVIGCAQVQKQPLILDPQFAASHVRQVLLAPVVFADEPLDRYLGTQAADEIQRQAARRLQDMGYDVVLATEPGTGFAGPPRVPPGADPVRMAPAVPTGKDGVIQIRVDHFLDSGLYDERSRIPLDIYATATLIAGDRRILWQGEGRGQGSWYAAPRLGPEDFQTAAAFLAESLFATLPSP